MTDKKKMQKKADALFEKYPEVSKIFISENGQCFFDEKSAKDYHVVREFNSEPEVFFREGAQDEDDQDIQEALHHSERARKELTAIIEEVNAVCDLQQDYKPADAETDETVTAVITLREKYTAKENDLADANAKLEELSKVAEENEDLRKQLETLGNLNNTPKTKKDASQTDRQKT